MLRPSLRHPVGAFGHDTFGRAAERAARFFGTPQYIAAQTVAVAAWIVLNAVGFVRHWDPYPFILLNLAFSTQAAYAAPLILLAQTRQAERDKAAAEAAEAHRDAVMAELESHERALERAATELRALLEENTRIADEDRELIRQVAALIQNIHAQVVPRPDASSPSSAGGPQVEGDPPSGKERQVLGEGGDLAG